MPTTLIHRDRCKGGVGVQSFEESSTMRQISTILSALNSDFEDCRYTMENEIEMIMKKKVSTKSRNNLASIIALMENIGLCFVRYDSKADKIVCYPNIYDIPEDNVPRFESRNYINAWCDASHSKSGAGGGIAIKDGRTIKGLSFKIPQITSSTQAELYTAVVTLLSFENCKNLNVKIDNKTAARINEDEMKNMFTEFWKDFSNNKGIRANSIWTKGHSNDEMNNFADELAKEGVNDEEMLFIHTTILKTLKDRTFIFDGNHLNPDWRKKVHDYYQEQLEPVDEKYQIIEECENYAKLSFQHLNDRYDSFTSTIINNMRSDTFAKLWDLKNKTRYECEICDKEATIEHILTECPLIYDSIQKLEEAISSVMRKYGLNKQVQVFWEGAKERLEKDKLAIGIRGLIPKQSMSQIAKSIKSKEIKNKSKNEITNTVTKKLEKCIYEIHREIAIFGWRRIKDFWSNNQHCYYEHKEDEIWM